MGVRAAKIQEYLAKNDIMIMSLPDFNIRRICFNMLKNYVKLLYVIMTKDKNDVVLLENERELRLLKFFKMFGFKLALDIRDNRALQRSAYRLDNDPLNIAKIQRNLLANIEICDFVFTVSRSCKELYPRNFHNKIFVIENASDPFLFSYREIPQIPRVGLLSGIAPGRGIEMLIEAMRIVRKRIPEATLAIGGAPAKGHRESIIYYAQLKKDLTEKWITFYDDIFYEVNASDFLQSCSLTVIPHPDHIHYHTTLPVKLFDSLSCGRPVVATACKETAEILCTYECGLVCDFTPEDMAEKITRLLLDRDLAARMGANGRRIVEEIYNWDHMAKKVISILNRE